MNRRSPILEALADLYAESKAGQTGIAQRDFSVRYLKLLESAQCLAGDRFENAVSDLAQVDGVALELVKNRRSGDVQRVVVPLELEAALFARIGRQSPSAERAAWAEMFRAMTNVAIPPALTSFWKDALIRRSDAIQRGEGWPPFRRKHLRRAHKQLETLARLLNWKRPVKQMLLRIVSAQVAETSKYLERNRGVLETLLPEVSGGNLKSFADLDITDNPRQVVFHGPLSIMLADVRKDYREFIGASSISEDDLLRASAIECAAPRCVTVENLTTFHQLCRLNCGDLFVFTSYPNRATVELLRRLPADLPRFHFGDTDPWGFDVLRTLRAALRPIPVGALHMTFREAPGAEPLTARDDRTLQRLLSDPLVADVHEELIRMREANNKGAFEQETIPVSGEFPYRSL
ncbi:MAG TPA: Wadjet anti-phage system protein JetD domain-containing protein [Chthoniobacteraceae bacterium]